MIGYRTYKMQARLGLLAVVTLAGASCMACKQATPHPLSELATVRMTIADQPFELWIADTDPTREQGLMYITAEQLAPLDDGTERGMIFVFQDDAPRCFWMYNTITPLDIAYVTSTGVVDSMHTMAPLDTRLNQYPSDGYVRYAIEVNARVWERLGLSVGDTIQIPNSVLNQGD